MPESVEGKELTDREILIVEWLSYGHSNPEIALMIGVAPNTVKKRLERIGDKLGAKGRAGIVGMAFRKGILSPDGGKADGPIQTL